MITTLVTGIAVVEALATVANPSRAKLLTPAAPAIEMCGSKWLTYQALRGHVPVPETVLLHNKAELADAADRFGMPFWVRSTTGQAAPTALMAKELIDAERWISFKRGWGDYTASVFLPGANLAITVLFDRAGRLIASTEHERLSYLESATAPSGARSSRGTGRTPKPPRKPPCAPSAAHAGSCPPASSRSTPRATGRTSRT